MYSSTLLKNLLLFKQVCASGIHANSHTGSGAAGARGTAPAGGAPWLRAELEAKSAADLRKLCAKLGLSRRRDGAELRKGQLLDSIVDSFSSQEGWSQGMGVVYGSTLLTIFFCSNRCLLLVSMQIPIQAAAQPNVEDGFVICRCDRGRKRYLDITHPTCVRGWA